MNLPVARLPPRNRKRGGQTTFILLTLMAGAHVLWRHCDAPSDITSGFMDAASDLAKRSVRAALGFHWTLLAVGLFD